MSFKCIIVSIKKNTWNIMSDAYWAHTLQTNVLQLTKFQNLSLKKLGKFFSKYVRIGAQFASSMIKWSAISYEPSKFQHFNEKYLMNILSQMLFTFNGLNVVFSSYSSLNEWLLPFFMPFSPLSLCCDRTIVSLYYLLLHINFITIHQYFSHRSYFVGLTKINECWFVHLQK